MAWGSIPCPSHPSTPPSSALSSWAAEGFPNPECAKRGLKHYTPPQACPSPEARILDAISAFPVSTATCEGHPSLSQPRSSPRHSFSLTASTRAGSRKDAWQQAQACSLGGCPRFLLSSMSCSALRGPRQAPSVPPCHWPSSPAKHHAPADSYNPSAVTQTPLPQGKSRDEMSPLSFWPAGAIPRSRLEGPRARRQQSPARAPAEG